MSLAAQFYERHPKRALHPAIECQIIAEPQLRANGISQKFLISQARQHVFFSLLIDELLDRHPLLLAKRPLEISGVHAVEMGDFFQAFTAEPIGFEKVNGLCNRRLFWYESFPYKSEMARF